MPAAAPAEALVEKRVFEAGRYATRVEVGEFDEGGCGIEMELGGTGHQGLDGGEIWWELGADGDWACWSSVEDRWLPPACRG